MSTNYRDPTHVPGKWEDVTEDNLESQALQLETFIREKMFGEDVRESLARWIEVTALIMKLIKIREQQFTDKVTDEMESGEKRISEVEDRQNEVEETMKKMLGSLTQDHEVINARFSEKYGDFTIIGDRFGNIETILANNISENVPTVKYDITHNLGKLVVAKCYYYSNALGTEENGLASGPEGTFGGIPVKEVITNTQIINDNQIEVLVPENYKISGTPTLGADGDYYIIDGINTLKFHIDYI